MGVSCMLSLDELTVLLGEVSVVYPALPFAKPLELQSSLPSPWDRVALCKTTTSKIS